MSKIDLIKHLYKAPSLVGKLTKWLILLIEFDVQYLTKKMIKERADTEFLALNLIPNLEEVQLDFPDDLNIAIKVQGWRTYFDGSEPIHSRNWGHTPHTRRRSGTDH